MTIEQTKTLERRIFGGVITVLFMTTVFFLKRDMDSDDRRYKEQKEFNRNVWEQVTGHEYRLQDLEKDRRYYYDRNREDKE